MVERGSSRMVKIRNDNVMTVESISSVGLHKPGGAVQCGRFGLVRFGCNECRRDEREKKKKDARMVDCRRFDGIDRVLHYSVRYAAASVWMQ